MGYFKHESAYIDEGAIIGNDTKIWHFSHIMTGCNIGEGCNIGQNVVISPNVVLGKNVKIQNNVSVYTGVVCEDDVFLGPSMVFTNVINPRSHNLTKRLFCRSQCDYRLRQRDRRVCPYRSRSRHNETCAGIRPRGR